MRRSCLLLAVLALLAAAPPASAGWGDHRDDPSRAHGRSDRAAIVPAGLTGAPLLTEWWKRVLEKPANDPTSPWVTGGCQMVSRTVALNYNGDCTVKAGTWIFDATWTIECSNVEPPPYHADHPLQAALCGLRNDRLVTEATIELDGAAPVSVLDHRFGVFMLPGRVVLPQNPVFGGTPGEVMRFGGHGWVAFIRPLPVGVHTMHAHVESTASDVPAEGLNFDTTITVTR